MRALITSLYLIVASASNLVSICSVTQSHSQVQFAAKEAHRYLRSLKCGSGLGITCTSLVSVSSLQDCLNLASSSPSEVVIVGLRDDFLKVDDVAASAFIASNHTSVPFSNILLALKDDAHVVHSLNSGRVVVCTGKTFRGTLYAVYSLLEMFGARFYLFGDVLPSPDSNVSLSRVVSKVSSPRFLVRGIQVKEIVPLNCAKKTSL